MTAVLKDAVQNASARATNLKLEDFLLGGDFFFVVFHLPLLFYHYLQKCKKQTKKSVSAVVTLKTQCLVFERLQIIRT